MSKIALTPHASGTGTLTIAAPNTNTDRTLTLPDATGTVNVSGLANEVPAGSVGSPSIYSTGDTNTGVFFPAADTVAVTTGGTERMRVDSSGNVGIGTSSPAYPLTVQATASGLGSTIVQRSGSQVDFHRTSIVYNNSGSAVGAFGAFAGGMYHEWGGGYGASGGLTFATNHANAGPITFATVNTERMRIDASGRVTTPYQPAFIAAGLAAQTTFTANQVIVFNTAPLNIGSGYSTSTGRFTAPVAGTYSFTYQLYLNPGNGNAPIGFFKNGTIEIFFLQGVTMSGIGLSTIISLAANDYVEVRLRNIVGASATIYQGGDHTQFTGYLLG